MLLTLPFRDATVSGSRYLGGPRIALGRAPRRPRADELPYVIVKACLEPEPPAPRGLLRGFAFLPIQTRRTWSKIGAQSGADAGCGHGRSGARMRYGLLSLCFQQGALITWVFLTGILISGALLLDHYGLVGRRRRPITLRRLADAMLFLIGVAIVLRF